MLHGKQPVVAFPPPVRDLVAFCAPPCLTLLVLTRQTAAMPVALHGAPRCEPCVSLLLQLRSLIAPPLRMQDAQQRWPQQPPAWQPPNAGRAGPQWGGPPPGWRGPPGMGGPYPPWGGPGRGGPFPGAMGYAIRSARMHAMRHLMLLPLQHDAWHGIWPNAGDGPRLSTAVLSWRRVRECVCAPPLEAADARCTGDKRRAATTATGCDCSVRGFARIFRALTPRHQDRGTDRKKRHRDDEPKEKSRRKDRRSRSRSRSR